MPNIASAKKRVRQTKKRTLRNSIVKGKMKFSIKKFNEAVQKEDSENIQTALTNAIKAIDKAAAKGVIHKNAAARKKSTLQKKLSSQDSAAS